MHDVCSSLWEDCIFMKQMKYQLPPIVTATIPNRMHMECIM